MTKHINKCVPGKYVLKKPFRREIEAAFKKEQLKSGDGSSESIVHAKYADIRTDAQLTDKLSDVELTNQNLLIVMRPSAANFRDVNHPLPQGVIRTDVAVTSDIVVALGSTAALATTKHSVENLTCFMGIYYNTDENHGKTSIATMLQFITQEDLRDSHWKFRKKTAPLYTAEFATAVAPSAAEFYKRAKRDAEIKHAHWKGLGVKDIMQIDHIRKFVIAQCQLRDANLYYPAIAILYNKAVSRAAMKSKIKKPKKGPVVGDKVPQLVRDMMNAAEEEEEEEEEVTCIKRPTKEDALGIEMGTVPGIGSVVASAP
jgi:hypothetical protein